MCIEQLIHLIVVLILVKFLMRRIVRLHLIRRIKYYQLPCQNISANLSCFYDDTYFCLCTNFGQQRLANCFEFNSTQHFDCFGQSDCLNGGQCLQDTPVLSINICMYMSKMLLWFTMSI